MGSPGLQLLVTQFWMQLALVLPQSKQDVAFTTNGAEIVRKNTAAKTLWKIFEIMRYLQLLILPMHILKVIS
jgi:hypothetical protein